MTAAGATSALREQDERVVQEVGGLAGERARAVAVASDASAGVVLGGQQDLGRLLGDLAAGRVDAAVEQRGRVGAGGPVGGASRDRRPERLEPGEALRRALGRRAVGVEAAPRPAVAGRPDRIDGDEQRVAVAVDREVDEPEHVAARLALAPQPVARARVEVDLAGRERRGERLGVHPGDHQDAAVGARPGRPPGRGRRRRSATAGAATDDARHATACGTSRTGRPAAAIAALTSAIGVDPAVEDRGGEDRVGAAVADRGDEVGRTGGATGRDDRHADRDR